MTFRAVLLVKLTLSLARYIEWRLNLASKSQAIIDARLTDEDRLKLTALQILPRPISRKS